jgi:hypothetical protein
MDDVETALSSPYRKLRGVKLMTWNGENAGPY